MRVPSFSNAASAIAVSVLLCAAIGSVMADVGGGKGHPATPWRISGPKNVQDIDKAKEVAAQYQTLSVPGELFDRNSKELVHLRRVSLRAQEAREGDKAGYALVGKSGSGRTVSLSFSQIKSFVVTSRKDGAITVSVTVWPDISPRELLDKQPTYKQLAADYKRTVILQMSLRTPDGRPVVFAEEGEFGRVLPLEKLRKGTKVDFYGEHPHMVHPLRFWWAIPSVANDKDYPYRMIPME